MYWESRGARCAGGRESGAGLRPASGVGTGHAKKRWVAAGCLEDLRVWQKSRVLAAEISATLEQPPLRNSWALKDQLARASLSIVANIAEGFAQQPDRAFARYLFLARASASEVRALLEVGHDQERLTTDQRKRLMGMYEVSRMLSSLIRCLVDADRRKRQLGR